VPCKRGRHIEWVRLQVALFFPQPRKCATEDANQYASSIVLSTHIAPQSHGRKFMDDFIWLIARRSLIAVNINVQSLLIRCCLLLLLPRTSPNHHSVTPPTRRKQPAKAINS